MKKTFTSLLFFVTFFSLNAQSGCPGCSISLPDELSGDTIFLSEIPAGEAGIYYEENISFRLPLSTTPVAATDPGVIPGLTIDEITILNVNNLPAGISWEADKSSYLLTEGSDGCIKLCGIPLEADSFVIDVQLNARISFINRETNVDLDMEVKPSISNSEGFNLANQEGCGSVTAEFENNVPSNGATGFDYFWDFGNGNSSVMENPPAQTYTEPGNYEINYTATIDTIGFILSEISVNDVSCSDLISKPDLYISIKDVNDLVVFKTSHVNNVTPPIKFFPNILVAPGDYTLEVWDEDGGLDGGDDVCAIINFTQESNGNFSSNDWDVDFEIIHPVDTIRSKDTVTVYPLPEVPTISKRGETIFCAGESVDLNSSYGQNNVWYLDGEAIAGAGDSSFLVTQGGNYQVEYTTDKGCKAISDPIEITVHPIPVAPSFTVQENVLTLDAEVPLSGDYSLQWYFNGSPIAEAVDTSLCTTESGSYRLVVTDNATGCTGSFETDVINNPDFNCLVSVEELDPSQIELSIFPNPVASDLTIEFYLEEQAEVNINFYDMLGRKLSTRLHAQFSGPVKHSINTIDWSNGIYIMELTIDDRQILKKIVKQ